MSTFRLKDYDVPVTLPKGLTEEKLTSFVHFNNWLKTLTQSLSLQAKDPSHPFHSDPYSLKSITVQSYDAFGPRIGFLKLKAEVTNAADTSALPGSIFLRGPAVAMLVVLVPDDKNADERYVLLTVQPRIPAGSLAFVELPAGMVDDGGEFSGAAAREIKEEIGMEIRADELVCLSDLAMEGEEDEEKENGEGLPVGMFPSAGGCDEHIKIYMHERRVPREQLREWTGKLTGLRDEGEKITLRLVRMQDLWRVGSRDAKALAAVALWQNLRSEGKI